MTSIIGKAREYGVGQAQRGHKSISNLLQRTRANARMRDPAFAPRRKLAQTLDRTPWHGFIPKDSGARRFDANTLPGTKDVVAACQNIITDRAEEFARMRESSGKSYLVNVLKEDDFEGYPALVDFALSESMIDAVSSYLGYLPRLGTINLLVSSPGKIVKGSQWLHTDAGDPDNVKCFVNITDVAANNGPLNVLPRNESLKFRRKVWNISGTGKYADANYQRHIDSDAFIRNVGPSGSGMLADTSKCFHFGGRVETGMRGMLVVHYSRFSFGRNHLPTNTQRTRWSTSPIRKELLMIDDT